MDDFASQVTSVGALAEPARRALYLYVSRAPAPVSRDQAAEDVGLPRHTAKFHLDRLVADGLLDAQYRRLSGRSGPGAGRPAKLYLRSAREVAVSLPPREYSLVGRVLAEAVERSARDDIPVLEAVRLAAVATGHRLAAAEDPTGADGPVADGPEADDHAATPGATDAADATLVEAARLLAAHGYEPLIEGGTVVLANCPFHALARDHTDLVCSMNVDLLGALLSAVGGGLRVRLQPAPGRCCVVVSHDTSAGG